MFLSTLLFTGLLYALPPSQATPPAARQPKFEYRDTDGCGRIYVYAFSEDHTEVLRVEWSLWTAMGLSNPQVTTWEGTRTFDLAKAPEELAVAVDLHPSANYSLYCTDVIYGRQERVVWRAVAGTLSIQVGKSTGPGYASCPVTIRLTGAVFVGPDGRQAAPSAPIVVNARAGRLVGG